MNAKDKDGHTARSLAFKNNKVKTVTLLDNASYIYRRMSSEPGGTQRDCCGGREISGKLDVELQSFQYLYKQMHQVLTFKPQCGTIKDTVVQFAGQVDC